MNVGWPTTVTSNSRNSHRIQIIHTEFKSLTPNSNNSHQIQIIHTEFKSLTPNSNQSHRIQITDTEFKTLTQNSNHSHRIQIKSHRIQIAYNEFKRRDTERNVICNLIRVFLSFKMAARTINFCSSLAWDQAPGMGRKKSASKAEQIVERGRGEGACLPVSSTSSARFARRVFSPYSPLRSIVPGYSSSGTSLSWH